MRRRQVLGRAGSLAAVALAGCSSESVGSDTTTGAPVDATGPTGEATAEATTTSARSRPDGVYVQSFRETMSMQGQATAGEYKFGLMFTVPHDFWTVTGQELSQVTQTDEDSIHLMASVWDPETRTVLPESGLSVEISDGDGLVSEEVIYPMLSQPMSFHYGGNFELDGDGPYTVEVSVGGMNIRRTDAFEDRFDGPASVEIPLEFTDSSRQDVTTQQIDQGGNPGALRPMDSPFPTAQVPESDSLPGTVRGSGMSDDAQFVVTTFEAASRIGEPDRTYLAVSARTRYNRYVLPAMALSATVDCDGEPVYDGPLERILSPDLGYHYGTAVDSVQSGDEVTLSVTTPPQVARHEGYETAFRQIDDVTITV